MLKYKYARKCKKIQQKGANTMKHQEIVQAILEKTERTDFWISNETANELLEEAEKVQLTGAGLLKISFQEYVISVVLKDKLLSEQDIAYVQIIYVRNKSDIIYLAEDGTENCLLL